MSVKTSKYLDEVVKGFQESIDQVRGMIEGLSSIELNTPEASGKWSMLQCLEHMSRATELYAQNVSAKLSGDSLKPAKETYRGHWKGRMFARMNAPKPGGEIPMKLKTFKSMEPPGNLNAREVIDRFYQVHETMIAVIDQSRSIDIDSTKVATALGSMIKLRVGEAYRFILAHTHRHIVQLERIKNTVAA